MLLPLVEADLLLAAHTRDRSPAGAGPRWGWGGGVEQQVACRELISEGNHSMCSQLERACINQDLSR